MIQEARLGLINVPCLRRHQQTIFQMRWFLRKCLQLIPMAVMLAKWWKLCLYFRWQWLIIYKVDIIWSLIFFIINCIPKIIVHCTSKGFSRLVISLLCLCFKSLAFFLFYNEHFLLPESKNVIASCNSFFQAIF